MLWLGEIICSLSLAMHPVVISLLILFLHDFFCAVVELPEEPDGKKFEVVFEREGQVEACTQTTRPVTVISDTPCYINNYYNSVNY